MSSFIRLYEEAVKHDSSKLPWDLLPYDAIEDIVKVLQYGAKKYSAHNWSAGFVWSRLFSALIRHAVAFWRGEDIDPESGLPHLAHLGCCVLFLIAHQKRGLGTDDRVSYVKEHTSGT